MTDVMLFVGGDRRSFKCACGCNVFHKSPVPGEIFTCNACGVQYTANPAFSVKTKRFGNLEAREIATLLHDVTCRWNHTDGCSWDYGSWEKPRQVHLRYLRYAEQLLITANVSFESAKRVLKFLKDTGF